MLHSLATNKDNPVNPKDKPVHPNGRHVVGIDIGLQSHSAAALTADGRDFGRAISITNDRSGVDRLERELLKPLGNPDGVLIGMEATGHYWMPLYFELQRRHYSMVVINPIQTRGQFRTRIRKAKTDKLDSRSIAHLVHGGKAMANRVPNEQVFALRLQTRHRWRLIDLSSDLKRFAYSLIDRIFPEFHGHFCSPLNATGRALLQQLGLAPAQLAEHADEVKTIIASASRNRITPSKVDALLEKARKSIGIRQAEDIMTKHLRDTLTVIQALEAQADALDSELEKLPVVANSPLQSLGLSAALIATIHAESDPISDFAHPWQYAAYAGIDPSCYESGQMRGTRTVISKRGSPHLRRALFLGAFSVYRRHTIFQRLYQTHRKKGRHHTDALVVVAHKLARVIWRLLTDRRDFRARAPKLKK
jgi:transposase